MRKRLCLVMGTALTLAVLAQAAQDKPKEPEKKAPTPKTLKIKLNYTGAGTVDEKHQIIVFLFDTPDFAQGGVMPIGSQLTAAKDGTVTFPDLTVSPVYAAACYDPTGGYDGVSGPPPTGSSMGIYSKEPGAPGPIALEEGKPTEVVLTFDDSFKLP
jgi:hypothetical protein